MKVFIERKAFFILVLVFLLAAPAGGFAAYMTAADLLRLCRLEGAENITSCRGYVAGVVDYHRLLRSLGTAPSIDFCIPDHVGIVQATDTVLDYLAVAPQHDQFIASPAVALALYQAFPCP